VAAFERQPMSDRCSCVRKDWLSQHVVLGSLEKRVCIKYNKTKVNIQAGRKVSIRTGSTPLVSCVKEVSSMEYAADWRRERICSVVLT
jgi:hypothetical protein